MEEFDKLFGPVSNNASAEPDEFSKIFGTNNTSPAPVIDKDAPDFVPGMQRGLQNLQASAYGAGVLVGKGLKEIGFEETGKKLWNAGLEGYQRNIAEAQQSAPKYSFKDVYTGEAGIGGAIDWAQGTLGELVPSMVEAAVGAAVGAMAGSATATPGVGTAAGAGIGAFAGRTILKKSIDEIVKKTIKEGTEKVVEDQIRSQVTKQALKKLGGKIGMGAAVFPMETGGMYAELLDSHGVDAPGTALLFGSLATAMEYAGGNSKLVDTFVDALAKGSTGMAKKSAKDILMNIPQEAMQEGGQELMNVLNTVVNTDEKLLTGANLERIIDSMAAGAIGGSAGAGAEYVGQSQQAGKKFDLRAEQETALNKQVDNIFSFGEDKVNTTLQTLQDNVAKNSELLNNQVALDKYAIDANIDPDTLIKQLVDDNNRTNFLIQGIQKRFTDQQTAKEKELTNISPEEKQVLDIQNRIKVQREEAALNINEQINGINEQLRTLRQQAAQEQDAEKRSGIYENVFSLIDSRDALLDKQKQVASTVDFAEPKKADEIRQEKESFYQQLWPGGVDKDAVESAQVFNEKTSEQQDILDRITTQIANTQDVQKKQELQKVYDGLFQTFERDANDAAQTFQNQDLSQFDQMVKAKDQERLNNVINSIVIEQDPQARQTMYEQLFMQPRIKDAAESASVFATQGKDADMVQRRKELQQTINNISQESDPVVRQKLYEQMFLQPGVKNAQESAEVFASLTPEEHVAYINKAKTQARKDLINTLNKVIGKDSASTFTNERQVEPAVETDRITKELDDFFKDVPNEATPNNVTIDQNNISSTTVESPILYTAKPGESIEEAELNQSKLNNYAKELKEAYTAGNLEIPQYMVALDLLARKDIAALEQVLDALSNMQENENDPSYAKTASFQAKGKADLKRLIKMLGSQMYKGNLAEITIKEVVQNSFDAVKASLADKSSKGIKDGRIDITVDSINRIIAIKDNGQGMSKKIILDAFLTVAGTDKSGLAAGDASGGFGMAKAAFLYGNEWISVNTAKNGKRYKFTAFGDEIISKAIDITEENVDKNEHGTVIVIKVPEYVEVDGEQKYVWFPSDVKDITFFKHPLLHDSIGIYLQDKYLAQDVIENLSDPNNDIWQPDNFSTINTGKHFDISGYNKNTTVSFDWGSADLYIANDRNSSTWNTQHNVLSAGVFQFNFDFNMGMFEKIPYNIILNVFPTAKADSATYPFNVRREGWKDVIEKDIKSLTEYVKNVALGIDAQQTVEQFKNIKSLPKIDVDDIGTDSINITNFLIDLDKKKLANLDQEAPAAITATPKITIDSGKVIAVADDGEKTVLIDTNKKEDEKVKGSFKADKETLKAKDFLIDVGIDDSQPIFHNNTNVDFLSLARENGYSGEVLFAELGSLMLKVRDFLASKAGYGFDSLKDKDKSVFVGMSIDKQYHGVNLVIPFQAVLLNPLAVKAKTLPGLVHGYYDTIVHEFTHVKERKHDESFISAQSQLKTLLASDGTDIELRVTLGRMLKKHQNLLNLLRNEYEKSATKNVAKSLNVATERNAKTSDGLTDGANGSIANGNGEWTGTFESAGRQADGSGISASLENSAGNVNFQITNQEAIGKVSIEDIKKAFPKQKITQAEDGTISVQFKNGKGLTINSIQQAEADFIKLAIETGQMSKNGKILGITVSNEILLNDNFANNKTLWHENKHVLDNLGLITADDDAALNREFNKLRKAGKLEFALSTHKDPKQAMIENRANMFAQIMVNRDAYRSTGFGKVIQRVMDFFQQLLSFGKQSVAGLARDVESGKVYERQSGDQGNKVSFTTDKNSTPEQIAQVVNPAIKYDGKMDGIPGVIDDMHNFTITLPDGKQPSFSIAGEVTIEKLTKQLNKVTTRFKQNPNENVKFQVAETLEQVISDETYAQMFNERNNLVRKIGQTLRMRGTEFKQLLDKGFGSISTRLKNVDPMLAAEMRNLDFRTSQKIVSALRIAHPLLDATKKMSSEDKFVWDAARRNSDTGKIKQIAEKYGIAQTQEDLRNVLNQIRQDAIDVGYDVGFIDEYWPRIIKDQEGFLQATKGISNQPVFTNALKMQADKLGLSVEKFQTDYPEVAADIISNTILGRNLGLGGPGNIQARQYETVPPELNKYYMDSDAALMQYIYSMTKKIEVRRFFGKVPERISGLKADRKRKDGQVLSYEEMLKTATPEASAELNKRIDDISGDLIRIDQELDKYKLQRDYTENIGAYIDDLILTGRISKDEEKIVRNILDARFHEHGTTGLINAYKNIAYIDVMGSPISAITQLGDLAWAMYVGKVWTPRGLSNTVKNISKAATKNSEITKEDLGIERIAQEFADGTTLGNAVSWVFKKVGLEKMDSIGKETLINNALDNYKAMVQTEAGRTSLTKYLKPIFGTQSDEVIQDLVANNHSENVKMLLYHRLLDFQPVALSEMPEQYLKSGNGRIFYMLKTYTLKQFDVFRNEAWHKIKTGERDQVIEGIGNMIKLTSLLALANAGADELKDLLLGKDVKFEDHVIENFLTMGGASRYVKMDIKKEGLGTALLKQILPPFKFVNSLSKDVVELRDQSVAGDILDFNNSRIIESLPLGGKLYYWHYGRGEDYKKSSGEQSFKDVGTEVDMFKRQLENADNKREFMYANIDKFKQMKLHENFQSALSRNQAVINKLKKVPETTNVIERLGKLKEQREVLLERYFEAAEGLK